MKSISKFTRYLIVGAANTAIGYSIYAALTYFFSTYSEYGYWFALIVGNVLSITIAFLNQKYFVFKTKGQHIKEFSKCCVVYGSSMLLGLVLVPFLKEICGFDPYTAGAIFVGISTFISFYGHLKFSFRRPVESRG